MADQPPKPNSDADPSWVVRALHVILEITKVVAPLVAAGLALYAARNTDRTHAAVGGITAEVQQTAATAQTIRKDASAAAHDAKTARTAVERRARENDQERGPQLYSTWVYLADVAAKSNDPRDAANAAEAKRVYDEYLKNRGK